MFHVPAHKNVAAPAGGVYLKAALQFGGYNEYVGVLSERRARLTATLTALGFTEALTDCQITRGGV